jgi:hypothetical protein
MKTSSNQIKNISQFSFSTATKRPWLKWREQNEALNNNVEGNLNV